MAHMFMLSAATDTSWIDRHYFTSKKNFWIIRCSVNAKALIYSKLMTAISVNNRFAWCRNIYTLQADTFSCLVKVSNKNKSLIKSASTMINHSSFIVMELRDAYIKGIHAVVISPKDLKTSKPEPKYFTEAVFHYFELFLRWISSVKNNNLNLIFAYHSYVTF